MIFATNTRAQRRSTTAQPGYTLIEFMMSIAILAFMVGLAVPSIQSGFAKQHLRSATIDVMDVFGFARVQAMSRNRAYVVTITGQDSATGKLSVGESSNTRCTGIDTGLQGVKVLDLSKGDYTDIRIVDSSPAGLGTGSLGLCFLPNGRVVQTDTLLPVASEQTGWAAGEAYLSIQAINLSSGTGVGVIHRIVIPYNGVPSMVPGQPGVPRV